MGVDLSLLPALHETDAGDLVCPLAFDLDLSTVITPFLDIERHRPSARVFWSIEPVPDGDPVWWGPWEGAPPVGGPLQYSMFGWASVDTEYVLAGDVRKTFSARADLLDDINDTERAAIAYICALDPATKVVLHWW